VVGDKQNLVCAPTPSSVGPPTPTNSLSLSPTPHAREFTYSPTHPEIKNATLTEVPIAISTELPVQVGSWKRLVQLRPRVVPCLEKSPLLKRSSSTLTDLDEVPNKRRLVSSLVTVHNENLAEVVQQPCHKQRVF